MVTFFLLKVAYNVTVTMGHVPGVVNVYADAAIQLIVALTFYWKRNLYLMYDVN